eukprot:gene10331-12083_t
MASHLNLEVGGYRYTLLAEDILKYPTNRLATMVMNCTPDEVIKIDRDGRVFQYIASYLVCGHIPRNENGAIRLDPLTLASLKEESRYFGLDKLFADCDQSCKARLNSDFHSYVDMHKYIQKVKKDSEQGEGSLKAIYATSSSTTPLLTALGQIWNPFCITGKIYGKYQGSKTVYLRKGSTIHDLKVDELIEPFVYAIPAKAPPNQVTRTGGDMEYISTIFDSYSANIYKALGASENTRALIRNLLETELQESDTIYIALQSLYPQYLDEQLMQQPDVLTMGDRALYDVLTQNNQYDVSCRSITVYHTSHEWINSSYLMMYSVTTTAQLFPSSSYKSATVAHTDSAANALSASDEQGPELKKQKIEPLHPLSAKLIVATTPAKDCVMYNQERAEWTGTKSLPEITIYVLRTLQVRKMHTFL